MSRDGVNDYSAMKGGRTVPYVYLDVFQCWLFTLETKTVYPVGIIDPIISDVFWVIVLRDDLGADPASFRLARPGPNSRHQCCDDHRRHRHVMTPLHD